MNISAEILKERLHLISPVQTFGSTEGALTLKRTSFLDLSKPVYADTIYLAQADVLWNATNDFLGITLVCIGGKPPSSLCGGACTLFVLEEETDLMHVFSSIQAIFSYFDAWDEDIARIAEETSSIRELIERSVPVFENPLVVSDRDLKVVVYTEIPKRSASEALVFTVKSTDVPATAHSVANLKPIIRPSGDRAGFYEHLGHQNLFVRLRREGHNLGALTLEGTQRPPRPYDMQLLYHLADKLEVAIRKKKSITGSGSLSLRTVFKDLLRGKYVSKQKIDELFNGEDGVAFICLCLKPVEDDSPIPIHYIFENIRMLYPQSTSFLHDSLIVSFIQLAKKENHYAESSEALDGFLAEIDYRAGFSSKFYDVAIAETCFRQARCAVETGFIIKPEERHYLFSEYVLFYMLQGCLGEFRPEQVCPPGLLKLRLISSSASVDYWRTLCIYLDNNMNMTQTSRVLFLHRSTLIQRIEKIRDIIEVDLDDPMMRTYIRLCLYAFDNLL